MGQETSYLFLMLQDFSEVRAACPIWHKLVCFALFFNVGIFHKTEIASFSQLQYMLLEHFLWRIFTLAITNLYPSSELFATFSPTGSSYNLSISYRLEN